MIQNAVDRGVVLGLMVAAAGLQWIQFAGLSIATYVVMASLLLLAFNGSLTRGRWFARLLWICYVFAFSAMGGAIIGAAIQGGEVLDPRFVVARVPFAVACVIASYASAISALSSGRSVSMFPYSFCVWTIFVVPSLIGSGPSLASAAGPVLALDSEALVGEFYRELALALDSLLPLSRAESNIRHVVALSTVFALAYQQQQTYRPRNVSFVVATGLVLASQSRSAWIASSIVFIGLAASILTRGKVSLRLGFRSFVTIALALIGAALMLPVLLGLSSAERDDSAAARGVISEGYLAAVAEALPSLPRIDDLPEESAHNLVLELTARAGVVGLVSSALLFAAILYGMIVALLLTVRTGDARGSMAFGLFGLSAVRLVTSGQVLSEPVVWLAMGAGLAALEVAKRSSVEVPLTSVSA